MNILKNVEKANRQDNLISVIVACYNVSEYLRECLDSLAEQTFQKIEVIMIDDCSDDTTPSIIDEYAQNHPNFIAVHNPENAGPSASRNKGIDLASGNWIAFVDGDDIVPSNAYSTMMLSAMNSGSEIVTGFVRRFDKSRDKPSYLHKKAIIDDYKHTSLKEHPELLYDTTSWNKLYKLEVLKRENIKFPINQIYEDVAFTSKAFLASSGIDILTNVVYRWRWRDGGNSSFTQVKNELPRYLDRLKSLYQVKNILEQYSLWHGSSKRQLLFKLLDVDIPLFMDDIADADDTFIYAFQEATIKFFREWDLLDTPLIKLLSAKKQYQYFALKTGNFDLLKQLSFGHPLNGKVANLDRKNRNIPIFHTPASLKVRITKVKYLNEQLNFAGSLQIGKKSPHHFPFKQEIVNVYLENIATGKKIKINTFTRPFTIFNFHLKRMTPPASKFSFSVNPVKYVEKLGLGTYKIKIDYKKSKSSKLLSVYLGQPKKGSGSVSTFTDPTGDISFIYGHNTNWETTIKAVPTSDLAIGSTKLPTTVTDVKLANSGSLIISGSSSELNLTAKIQDTPLPCSFDNNGNFKLEIESTFLKNYFNQSCKVNFINTQTGLTILPSFKITEQLLNNSTLSVALSINPAKGLWIRPDVSIALANNVQFTKNSNAVSLQFEVIPSISTEKLNATGKIELLSSDLINRYLNGGTATVLGNKIVGTIPLGNPTQLNVLSGKYHIYLNLLDSKNISYRFKLANINPVQIPVQNHSINKRTNSTVLLDKFGFLKLNINQTKSWIDRTKIRRGLTYSVLYPLMRLLPLKKDTVLFESLWGQSYNDSPRAMYKYLSKQRPNMKFVWILKNEQTPVEGPAIRVRQMSFKYWYYMARAKYLVQNTNFPNQYSKRAGQIEVETLHGTFMKVMGFDEPHFKNASNRVQKNFAKRIGRWDLMSVPSDFMLKHGSAAFDYPEKKILKTGFPRTDELITNNNTDYLASIKKKLNLPDNKKVILYAPTYRTTKDAFNFELDLDMMQKELSDEYVLLVRLHYFVSHSQNFLNNSGFVYDVSDYNNINDLYLISDVLITDYSSVMFDFGYLRKPMIFFAYDKDWYLDPSNRGIYMDYDATVPGPVALTTADVVNSLKHIDDVKVKYSDKLQQFYDKFCEYGRDGDAAQRLSEAMLSLKPENQSSVENNLIRSKIQRLLKLNNIQHKLLNILGQLLPKANIAMFESFFGRQYSDNPKAIYEYMKQNYPEIKLYWNVNKDYEEYFKKHNIPYVIRFSLRSIWIQARAKYWFTNVRRPFRWFKPKDTVVVQTWHGTPLKTIGTDVQQVTMPGVTRMKYHKQVIRDSARWDYLLTPNPYSYEIMQRAFRKQYPQLLPTGYPRNDRLSNATKDDINLLKDGLNIAHNQKVVLYAPTWRDNDFVRADHYRAELHLDLDKLIADLPQNTLILVRTHYLIANNLDLTKYGNRVINVSDYEDITDLYLISDVLITDYSSVFFDYSILRRPMIFFAYDLKAYAEDIRGFYMDYNSTVPGPVVETNEELIPLVQQALTEPTKFIDNDQYRAFLEKFASWEDGHSTERLLETVLENKPPYELQQLTNSDSLVVGDQIQIKDTTILWSGIPGVKGTKFIKNIDLSEREEPVFIKQIATLTPRDFRSSNLYTGGVWINGIIDHESFWFNAKNVLAS